MDILQTIKDSLNKETVKEMIIDNGGTNVVLTGNTIRSTCPLHGGNNASAFVWNLENNTWYCHTGCQTGGDIFEFFAIKEDLDTSIAFLEVVRRTATYFGIDATRIHDNRKLRMQLRELKNWKMYVANQQDKEVLPTFNQSQLQLKRYGEYRGMVGYEDGFGYSNTYNRLAFPVKDENGRLVGVQMRTLTNETPRWLIRPKGLKLGWLLFNLDEAKKEREVYVVEGQIDCIRLKRMGYNAVATFGAHVTEEQSLLLSKYFDRVILCFDGDQAGMNATKTAVDKLRHLLDVGVIDLTETLYNDPGEIETREMFDEIPVKNLIQYLGIEL